MRGANTYRGHPQHVQSRWSAPAYVFKRGQHPGALGKDYRPYKPDHPTSGGCIRPRHRKAPAA